MTDTPLTAEKIAELEERIALSLDYSRNFASAKPNMGSAERVHIEGLCNLLEQSSRDFLSLAKRVAGAPAGPDPGAALAVVIRAREGIVKWERGYAFGDRPEDHYLFGDLSALMLGLEKQRVAMVEIVGGEEG
jgi:hypothetical protein